MFAPIQSDDWIAGVPNTHVKFSMGSFFALLGAFYIFMRRILVQVDPKDVVPARVQKAFDTMSNGVLVLDKNGVILESNSAFRSTLKIEDEDLIGKYAKDLRWDGSENFQLPWERAVEHNEVVEGVRLVHSSVDGTQRPLMVNASNILDAKDRTAGALVRFQDVTEVEKANDELSDALAILEQNQIEITERNKELEYVASHDAMTNCLNRRAFFIQFEETMDEVHQQNQPLGCIMVDLDHFKSVNDRFGHATGDRVIQGVASILRQNCGEGDFTGRYGGEEFSCVFRNKTESECFAIAERIRYEIIAESPAWFPTGESATASIGLAMRGFVVGEGACEQLVDLADQALYDAKES